MIVDLLKRADLYRHLHPALVEALDFLQSRDFNLAETGRYSFGEYGNFAMVSLYATKPPNQAWPEAHRKYIDVQYVVSGVEWIGYASLAGQEIHKPYDEERDLIFYNTDPSLIRMDPGMFAIFFPGDLHMPGIDRDNPGGGLPSVEVKKVVVKVPVSALEE